MTFRYEWKQLDGVYLHEPQAMGPKYDREYLNIPGGFETEQQAVDAYEAFTKKYGERVYHGYVLIKFYLPA